MPKKQPYENPWRDCPQPEPNYMQEISRRFSESVRSALLEHKRIGNSIAVWEDGAVRIVPADQIDELMDKAAGVGR
jgi:hypothetical protein